MSDLELDPDALTLADHESLRRRIRGVRKVKSAERRKKIRTKIAADIETARQRYARRAAQVPEITYPSELPISARHDELIDTIRSSQVVVVAGETGSGKSTQLPKLALEAGFGVRGTIGHTQPRRIAARSVAARIADELSVDVGGLVGHSVRFDNRTSDNTAIKVMTDGILLAELQRDPDLLAYDLLIVDEAHERSLNIDFLLGYLHRLVRRRPELHVVVTSATIDTEKIAKHFADDSGEPAPIIEVSGRTYPVEIRYQPPIDPVTERPLDPAVAVGRAVDELTREGAGDILVFSSGEAEINDICEHLRRHHGELEVLPLYARLATKEQQRVFQRSKRTRVIVSTNVAETSLTVPGIRYVVDVGEARISRFSNRTKVQRLPIEPVSQASANQRSGRCGRLGPGIAVRLYEEEDFDARPEFTEPEIQRTNLAAVLLTMADQQLGSPHDFPFIDPPDPRSIADGARLLYELGAVDRPQAGGDRSWLTPLGQRLARLPIDPRLGRIVLAGDHEGCLREAVVIAGALSVQDPKERPRERRQAADTAHADFADPRSDVLSWLHLFNAAQIERRDRSRRQFARWCRERFLHAQRMNEWFSIVEQLTTATEDLDLAMSWSSDFDMRLGPTASDGVENRGDDIHRAVLTAMLTQVGMRHERSHEYQGARNMRFAIQPGSVCFESKPDWIMATTLVETSRLWARNVAPIDPGWLEEPAAHLTSIEIGDPEWNADHARALVIETVRLHGLPIIADRMAPLDRHDATTAREMFIHHALIENDWSARYPFVGINDGVRREARNLAARDTAANRRSFDQEYERVYAFYDAALPIDITGGAKFEQWFSAQAANEPHLFEMAITDLLTSDEIEVDQQQFPDSVEHGDVTLTLDYQAATEGLAASIAVDVPLTAVDQIEPSSFLGIVPGHRREAVIALVRAFPKPLRKRLVPVPGTVDEILEELGGVAAADAAGAFALGLRHALERRVGETLPLDALDPRSLPPELRPNYRVVDDDGRPLAQGHDLGQLRADLRTEVSKALTDGVDGVTHTGATDWQFGTLPRSVEVTNRQGSTTAYPALVEYRKGDDFVVGVELVSTPGQQRQTSWTGTRRLLRLTVSAPLRQMQSVLDPQRMLALELSPHGERKAWFEDLTLACLGTIIDETDIPWSGDEFAALQRAARDRLTDLAIEAAPVAAEIIDETAAIRLALAGAEQLPGDAVRDARDHLERLTFPGHLAAVGLTRHADVLRYLRGLRHRLAKLPSRINADHQSMMQARTVEAAYDTVVEHLAWSPALEDIAWSLEELRVSLFAQHLGTAEKVSPTRIRRRLERLSAA